MSQLSQEIYDPATLKPTQACPVCKKGTLFKDGQQLRCDHSPFAHCWPIQTSRR